MRIGILPKINKNEIRGKKSSAIPFFEGIAFCLISNYHFSIWRRHRHGPEIIVMPRVETSH